STRHRLLLFSDADKKNGGDVVAYDLKTGKAVSLNPAGREKAAVHSRETVYLAEHDLVLIGAHVRGGDGKLLWPAYDCVKNAWVGLDLGGEDPVGKGTFNNSMGLMVDPHRKLVWAVGQNSHVHVLRLDRKTVRAEELKD